MAELVDAPASGAGARKGVEVRVLFRAPFTCSRASAKARQTPGFLPLSPSTRLRTFAFVRPRRDQNGGLFLEGLFMALTDTAVRTAKPRDREYKLADGGGLYLLVTAAGGKLWRLKYRAHGVERKLALGRYPDVTLSAARKARDDARVKAGAGDDPAAAKRRERVAAKLAAGTTFGAVALEYTIKAEREGRVPATISKLHWAREWLQPAIEQSQIGLSRSLYRLWR